MSDGGKGSRPRPFSVDAETFASNWDRIFSKKTVAVDNGSEPQGITGAQRYNQQGLLEEYHEGYWSVVPFRSSRD